MALAISGSNMRSIPAAKSHVVLAGNNPGYASVMADTPEVLFDPYNVEVAAKLLHRVLTDKVFAADIHNKQQELVKQFDIAVVGPYIEAEYKRLLAKHKL